MMLSRRAFLQTTAAAVSAASAATPAAAALVGPAMLIYDSRISVSLAFAQRSARARIDLAHMEGERWASLRRTLPDGPIVGLSRWSDYVMARGFAQEQGRRVRMERRVGGLVEWQMV